MFRLQSGPGGSPNRSFDPCWTGAILWLFALFLAAMIAMTAFAPEARSGNHEDEEEIPFDEANVFFELDNTDGDLGSGKFCGATSKAARTACGNDVRDDYWTTVGNCANLADPAARSVCLDDADSERVEGRGLCAEQYDARQDLCGALGEAPYDPAFDSAGFVDPLEIGVTVDANPYFPLEQGRRWVYEGGGETITVTVTDRVKTIGGVDCVTVNDLVEDDDGASVEDTDDWYAQDLDGNVWYCGEIALNFEDGELVDIEGSWEAFRDFAKPGILMQAAPMVGQVYRQEFALSNAEDAAEVIATDATATAPAASCDGDCVVTADFTPIEPDALEHKFYAPGIGMILERDPETGETVELVDFTTP